MGFYEHKTIVITGEGEHLENAHKKAKELFSVDDENNKVDMVSNIIGTGLNQTYSFFITPCGSKVGWDTDNYFNEKYNEMVEYLKSINCTFEDGSSLISWIFVQYGDTDSKILKTNCTNI